MNFPRQYQAAEVIPKPTNSHKSYQLKQEIREIVTSVMLV
jgi:hypothetical protein